MSAAHEAEDLSKILPFTLLGRLPVPESWRSLRNLFNGQPLEGSKDWRMSFVRGRTRKDSGGLISDLINFPKDSGEG